VFTADAFFQLTGLSSNQPDRLQTPLRLSQPQDPGAGRSLRRLQRRHDSFTWSRSSRERETKVFLSAGEAEAWLEGLVVSTVDGSRPTF